MILQRDLRGSRLTVWLTPLSQTQHRVSPPARPPSPSPSRESRESARVTLCDV